MSYSMFYAVTQQPRIAYTWDHTWDQSSPVPACTHAGLAQPPLQNRTLLQPIYASEQLQGGGCIPGALRKGSYVRAQAMTIWTLA